MNLTRRLTEGVGAWLHFELTCDRSGLFNESYLSGPVGQILSAAYGDRVQGEFEHPVLGPAMAGRGRRPSLDFVYCDPFPTVKVAVETKWAGSTHTTPDSIVWDLIRLELVAHHFGAQCIFLLAGKRADLTQLFRLTDFAGPANTPGRLPILSTTHNSLSRLSLLPDKHYRIPLLKKVMERCQNLLVPHSIITRRTDPFPVDCRTKHFQVFAWEIIPEKKRQEFVPANNKHLKIAPSFA